ncbi:uncharacterized protein BDZ99DRAFT_515025 [Mytilinidion resinicola]|uniref:Uncharacterized protein n=1 Tax=Mytilinidion resinicola TaxID=574789 RepID=A0A6A6Z8B6_9PEZI|nr:uncharacterized protein BDZ99DRAFT_515025 [Mytilinidion resinicola]KAF2816437.1 hypothetical protein BDZ99DRAFT_515025 [Mytilinidion resinicola]
MCLARLLLFTCGCRTPAERADDWIRRCRQGKIFHYSECTARKTRTYVLSFPCWSCYHALKLGKLQIGEGEEMKEEDDEGDEMSEKMEEVWVEEGRGEGDR